MMDSEQDLKIEDRLDGKQSGWGQKSLRERERCWYDSYISASRTAVHGDMLH